MGELVLLVAWLAPFIAFFYVIGLLRMMAGDVRAIRKAVERSEVLK